MLLSKTWQVSYGSAVLGCKNEHDAKLLARELVKKGHRVQAQTREGQDPSRVIESHNIHSWLVE
jgi:hypothetical protein